MNRLLPMVLVTLTACGGGVVAADDAPQPAPSATTKPPVSYPHPPDAGSDQVAPSTAACPTFVPAPASCGDYAAACAGAEPIAVGTFGKIGSLVVGAAIHFRVDDTDLASGCGSPS